MNMYKAQIESQSLDKNSLTKYLIVKISNERYCFNLKYIKEVLMMPEISSMPNMPEDFRGIFSLRNSIIPLLDSRKKLNYPSLDSEEEAFIAMLKQREQDHINWLNELNASVEENRDFRLTTDPHACAFGKWYDNYETENITIANFLENFDKPHRKIHQKAIEVRELLDKEGKDVALEAINHAKRHELKLMLSLFSELYGIIQKSRKEFAIIIEIDGKSKACSVDAIDKIIDIPEDDIKEAGDESNSEYLRGTYLHNNNPLIIINLQKFINGSI